MIALFVFKPFNIKYYEKFFKKFLNYMHFYLVCTILCHFLLVNKSKILKFIKSPLIYVIEQAYIQKTC